MSTRIAFVYDDADGIATEVVYDGQDFVAYQGEVEVARLENYLGDVEDHYTVEDRLREQMNQEPQP